MEFIQHQITVRIIYTLSSFAVSKALTYLALPVVQGALANIFVNSTLKPGADKYLESAITGLLMAGAEFLIYILHKKTVLPAIQKQELPK